jgi:23S rRNA (uracil1939-C5)-methyltransferase
LVERLTIDHIGRRGDGVAHGADGPIYVPYALPGEIVEADPWPGHPDRRNLLRIETASPERIDPVCPHFGVCGGCAVQHWRRERYRAWKRDLVAAALTEAGIAAPTDLVGDLVGDLIDAHGEGRRRCVLHARRGTHDILEVGFASLHAHRIVPIDRCPILAPGLGGIIDAAWAIAETLRGSGKPLDIQATATDAGIDVDVRGSGPLTPQMSAALAGIAETHRLARITRHGELVAQRVQPTIRIGRATVALPPGAFLQATACGEATLANLVLAHAGAATAVADLFAGIGPFALRLCRAQPGRRGGRRRTRNRSAAPGGGEDPEPQTGRSGAPRPFFRRPFVAAELSRVDAVVFDHRSRAPRREPRCHHRRRVLQRAATFGSVRFGRHRSPDDTRIPQRSHQRNPGRPSSRTCRAFCY